MTIHDLFDSDGKKVPENDSQKDSSQEKEFVHAEVFEGHDYIDFEKIKLNREQESFSVKAHILFFILSALLVLVFILHLALVGVSLFLSTITLFQFPAFVDVTKRYLKRTKIVFIMFIISLVGVISPSVALMLLMTCLMIFVKQSSDDKFLSSVLHWFNNKI